MANSTFDTISPELHHTKPGVFYADKIHWSAENKELLLTGKINVKFANNNFKGNGSFSGLGRIQLLIINGQKASAGSSITTSGNKCVIQARSKQDAVAKYGNEGEFGAVEITIPQ